MARIVVEGIPNLKRRLAEAAAAVEAGALEGQRDGARMVADDWRENVPVLTGAYRDSIDSDDESAFTDIEYAPFVEFGTSTHPARPAGSQAAQRVSTRYPVVVGEEIRRRLPL